LHEYIYAFEEINLVKIFENEQIAVGPEKTELLIVEPHVMVE
jgi:hypothetical protein